MEQQAQDWLSCKHFKIRKGDISFTLQSSGSNIIITSIYWVIFNLSEKNRYSSHAYVNELLVQDCLYMKPKELPCTCQSISDVMSDSIRCSELLKSF